MVRFGINGIYDTKLSLFGRIGFFIHGTPHIAKFIQGHYFAKNINNLISKEISTVLDIGCGPGDFSFYLAEKHPYLNIDALDFNKEAIKNAIERMNHKYHNEIKFINSEFQSFNFKSKYDLVLCVEVLHTVKNKFAFLKKISSSVKEDGFFYFQDRMKGDYCRGIINPYSRSDNEYFIKFTKYEQLDDKKILEYLEKLNFEILKKGRIIGFFGQIAWEIDQILLDSKIKYLKTIFIPALKLLCILDFAFPIGRKNESYVVAKKLKE